MGEIVYVDLLFLINFSMDYLCFYLCSVILSRKLSPIRAVFASAIGGIYSDVALFIELPRIYSLFLDISVCVLMCAVAYHKRGKWRELPLYVLVYFASSMALGGFMTALFNLLNRADLPIGEGGEDGISVFSFALLAAISALITLVGGRFFKRKSQERAAKLIVWYNGKSAELRALCDSGNLLREPISRKPCIVCEISALEGILPSSLCRAAREGRISEIGRMRASECSGIRIIPMNTAGGDGMLLGIAADGIVVRYGKNERNIDAYIALGNIKNGSESYDALLPTELLI